jgi:hypothetical protein
VFRKDVFLEENSRFGVDLSDIEWKSTGIPEQKTVEEVLLDTPEG